MMIDNYEEVHGQFSGKKIPNQPLMDVTIMMEKNEEIHGHYKREKKSQISP